MSIRFVAARPIGSTGLSRALTARAPRDAANDNRPALSARAAEPDGLLRAALRHFAEHGLSAAEQARRNAEEAFFAGRSDDYRWWLAICTALDRRMAAAIEFRNQAGRK